MFDEDRTYIMGVLNVTPDSFHDGGKFIDFNLAVEHAKQMIQDGADIIDVGGESTKPGSDPVSEEEEINRVIPVIEKLSSLDVIISIDTSKPKVAELALNAGAHIINDVTGLNNGMREVAAKHKCPVIIMHMKGKPKNMQKDIVYDDVVSEIKEFLAGRVKLAKEVGINDIFIDPGIGFGKELKHNLELIRRLNEFNEIAPVLLGVSRKSFIGKLIGEENTSERLEGSLSANVIGIMNGAKIIRVHDVKESKRAALIADSIKWQK